MLDVDEAPAGPIDKKGNTCIIDVVQYEQVHRWVLQRSPENDDWESKYQRYKDLTLGKGRQRILNAAKVVGYFPWLRSQLINDDMCRFKRLANGPDFNALSYNSYTINGYIFCTAESEKNATTQNSGVSIDAVTQFRSSARDKNYVVETTTYYGIIRQILEINYYDFKEVVFYCDWVRIEDTVNGCVTDKELDLRYVNFSRFKNNSRENDEPCILASEAKQVFYIKDVTRDDWYVVRDAPKRLCREVDAYEDPLVFEARMESNNIFQNAIVEDALD